MIEYRHSIFTLVYMFCDEVEWRYVKEKLL